MSRRSLAPWFAAALGLAACGSAPAPAADASGPPLDEAQQRQLKEAERLYRAGDAGFAVARDALAAQPATAWWLARLLVRDVVWYTDHQQADDATFLNEATGRKSTRLERARGELAALGAAAVPCIVADLLKSRFNDRRALGAQLLAQIGPAALPQMAPLLRDNDARLRRLGAEALGHMPRGPEVDAELRRLAGDPDFTVRATAYEGLARGGPEVAPLLRQALLEDPDPFVRRALPPLLQRFHDRETALALVEYLRRATEAGDGRGVEAARKALVAMSGLRGNLNVAGWQGWARSLPAAR
jgi:hypothetical protein